MFLKEGDLRRDDEYLLKDHFYGFMSLARPHVPISRYFSKAFRCTFFAEATFIFVLAAFLLNSRPLSVLSTIIALAVLGYQFAMLVVLVASIWVGKLHKRPVCRAVLYYAWWPVCTLLVSLAAAGVAALIGAWLWHSFLKHYYALGALQMYKYVDPSVMPGEMVQDAGIVNFASARLGGVGVDRSKAGCLVNGGTTYCVAPIVEGSHMHPNLGHVPRFGSFDYFAVGVDCCDCPVQEFRCGAWEDPTAHGGLRSMDVNSRPFYRLAVDQWVAAHRKVSKHPLFFDWVKAPLVHWRGEWNYVVHAAVLASCAAAVSIFCLALVVQWLRARLEARGLASRMGAPAPPNGLLKAWELFLPDLLQQHLDEQQQQLPPGLPRFYRSLLQTAPGRPSEGPESSTRQHKAPPRPAALSPAPVAAGTPRTERPPQPPQLPRAPGPC